MRHITDMLTQTQCDLTEALFLRLKVAVKVQIIYCGTGCVNIYKHDFLPPIISALHES